MIQSRKFKIMLFDTLISLIVTLATWYLSPADLHKVLTLIGILQAPVLAVIGGIAVEDAALKHSGKTPDA